MPGVSGQKGRINMKKLVSLTLSLLLCAVLFGCGNSAPQSSSPQSSAPQSSAPQSSSESPASQSSALSSNEESSSEPAASAQTARVAALKGPTAMGMVKMMEDDASASSPKYDFSISASADEITPKLVQGELDIAAVPANLASVLYNKTEGKIQVLAVNTLGVLYLVESGDSVHSVEDLRGRTIYASGKGATPEYALSYLLTQNDIDPAADVTIEWKSEHSECVAALAAEENAVALLPQPFVTTAQAKNESIRVALDLNEEWEKLSSEDGSAATLITGVAVVRKEFAENNPELINTFLQEYQSSVEYVNGETESAAALVGKFDIVPEAVAKKALPACNITFIQGGEMKEKLSFYLQTLMEQNPKAVGGTLPADDFYYAG